MNNSAINTLVLVGDDIYADIATCYLAIQLEPFNVNIVRLKGAAASNHNLINADHSVHAFHQDIGLDFNQLMQAKLLTPRLAVEQNFYNSTAYMESYPYLKDDLPLPYHQCMMKLIQAGITSDYYSASPLVSLHKAGKFHPQLHKFYRGEIRPYGVSVDAASYSTILNNIAQNKAVEFINSMSAEIKLTQEGRVEELVVENRSLTGNVFIVDMSKDQRLMSSVRMHQKNDGRDDELCWINNCLSFDKLMRSIKEPAVYFEWLFRSLVRFVDFFPDTNRNNALAAEYNRLQEQDCMAMVNFVNLCDALNAQDPQSHFHENVKCHVSLFVESCQFSEVAISRAYPDSWAPFLVAAGLRPKQLPRRVEEVSLQHLKNWYYQRQQNIHYLLERSI